MLWLITSIFVDRFIQMAKYENFLFGDDEEIEEEVEEIVSNIDLTYDGQVSYHFKRKGSKAKSPKAANAKKPEDKKEGPSFF